MRLSCAEQLNPHTCSFGSNEKNWAENGGARPSVHLNPPLVYADLVSFHNTLILLNASPPIIFNRSSNKKSQVLFGSGILISGQVDRG